MEKQVTWGSFAPAQGKVATAVGAHPGLPVETPQSRGKKFFEKI